ncbi:cytochrome P450 [Cryphonectria parasitica EP155]|uniref:Cytochrome P450 n=1 Tax=Cryphonectria parasitica (strain ATCC 38755 / EP155) TaxID=660469 RepID=A0A9P5CKW1_CRYP1|nr:cytochrome P450 [Cryphonectria parasitica EP155]KAF3761195.1 cytochrome P450 [Cryphonectria parasitica EP155]
MHRTSMIRGLSQVARGAYCVFHHPLAKFPGPRVAAVSNLWYAYHWMSGRYPWAIEDAFRKYGPVVRIAPNELVFYTPQAFTDIYATQHRGLESFPKTDFQDRGKDLGGIAWENDPVRHREVAKKLAPAFSSRAIRAMEPLVHEYMDYFIQRMKDLGPSAAGGVSLLDWTNWLALDLAADLAWGQKMHEMRNMKSATYLEALLAFNSFATVMQVFKKFPLLVLLQYFFVPLHKLGAFVAMETATRQATLRCIDMIGKTEHPDFFDYILPPDEPKPTEKRQLVHLGSLGLQMMFANWGPMADWWYGTLLYLLDEPACYSHLVKEIRGNIYSYDDINPTTLASLPFLHACLEETLRLLPTNLTGLPRYSPGAVVDGYFVPKGTTVQSSIFTLARSPDYIRDPLCYRPQHELKSLPFFSLGPRACLGREMAWMQGKLFLAKVLWVFDVVKVTLRRKILGLRPCS